MDGSPRAMVEAVIVDGALNFYNREKVFPIFIETSRDLSRQRLMARGRFDDTEESINERLDYFDDAHNASCKLLRKRKQLQTYKGERRAGYGKSSSGNFGESFQMTILRNIEEINNIKEGGKILASILRDVAGMVLQGLKQWSWTRWQRN